MIGKSSESITRALPGQRAGIANLAVRKLLLRRELPMFQVRSSAFDYFGRIPPTFTADGPGLSPPLDWLNVPDSTDCVALIVEDADSPTPQPLVHAIAVIEGGEGSLGVGALAPADRGAEVVTMGSDHVSTGLNSFLRRAWLPPDPPAGHGEHRYVFQMFALRAGGELPSGRTALLETVMDRGLAIGWLVGVYSREQPVKVDDMADALDLPDEVPIFATA
jgi:phosphatidylethanolamine-binding protein (PEBP) family uncharacterized protein